MEDRVDTTLPLPRVAVDLIDAQLKYGDSRAGWMRQGVYARLLATLDTEELERLPELDGIDAPDMDLVIKGSGDGGDGVRIVIEAENWDDAHEKFKDAMLDAAADRPSDEATETEFRPDVSLS